MKPILNKEIVLDFIFNANKVETENTLEGIAKNIGRKDVLIELLNLTENHI